VEALRHKAAEAPAMAGAIALGELIEGADLDRCVERAQIMRSPSCAPRCRRSIVAEARRCSLDTASC
jgi:hypothetical protein